MSGYPIGRLLRAGMTGFVVGCRVSEADSPVFGGLVRVPLQETFNVFGLIYDIHIDDDGLVRQLVTAQEIDESIVADNRTNRNVPIEMSVLTVGYHDARGFRHLLPPRPPLSLDRIYTCTPQELRDFTGSGHYGYFRHILRAPDLPVSELLAAHLEQAQAAHLSSGDPDWANRATQELITLLRDDYPLLMKVLSALSDSRV
jgi:hypothetical protein